MPCRQRFMLSPVVHTQSMLNFGRASPTEPCQRTAPFRQTPQQRIGLVQARRPLRSIAVILAKDPLIFSRLKSAVVKSVSSLTLEWEDPPAGEVYSAYRRRPNGQSGAALLGRYLKELRALAGIEVPGVQFREQNSRVQAGAALHHPDLTPVGVCRAEVCVVSGDNLVVAILAEQTINIAGTVPFAGAFCTAGIEDFYGPSSWHGQEVLIGQIVPCGMGRSYVGTGLPGPFRQLGTGLRAARRRKVGRQNRRPECATDPPDW